LKQINDAVIERLKALNTRNFQGKEYSRQDLFLKDEKPHLAELPSTIFDIRKSTTAKVQRNYHVILGEDKRRYRYRINT
jgi:hypothetical protein